MSKVMAVDFDGHKIRSIKIDNEVWFVAKDVVEGLGITVYDAIKSGLKA